MITLILLLVLNLSILLIIYILLSLIIGLVFCYILKHLNTKKPLYPYIPVSKYDLITKLRNKQTCLVYCTDTEEWDRYLKQNNFTTYTKERDEANPEYIIYKFRELNK